MRARILLPAALTAALLTLSACGAGSGSASAGDTGAAPSNASSPAPSPTRSHDSGSGSQGAQVPEALNFTATTVDGRSFDAKTLAGKPTLLWFWAPWCPTCKGQAAETAKVAAAYRGRANVVGVAGLDGNAAMRDFVTDTGTGSFPHLSDEKGEVWKRFRITQQSSYVLLDRTGDTVFEGVLPGGKGLAEKIAALTG
ncbi:MULTISPECIES: redoxin domain-containing protein [unclassified Streptomyces]|uniref:redoxin domain-containing protein n=1 Tax=unclassified Streptomyces TaxID=2593676 RepID=UPI001F04C2E1|nr:MULTISPECIES: redoxin domain-containing protein [unclassified Streptomyces]MCH0562993.1 redoxin domain-containing protein [Streptomyces sp. MUM 2J]MCH0571953.1 redoxin domain-containing protein [Streptomyces sp. MUM 136J]